VIDEYNGLGFFGFLLPRCMILIHQLYARFWFRELGPLGLVPYLLEPLFVRAYRNRPAMTLSESTRDDLKGFGYRDVHIVMVGLAPIPDSRTARKEDEPTLVFLGRLRSTKRPEDALRILERVQLQVPNARLWMIGRGPEEARLRRRAAQLGNVVFHGWVDEERKFELLSRAHLLLVPGVREGFGINVIEAAHQGTPAIGYRVHGLRDSIRDGTTGVLVQGPEQAAEAALTLLRDRARYERMVQASRAHARTFKWSERAREFRMVVDRVVAQYDATKPRATHPKSDS
jgi:glycosyltransferase involved in cell wall biosynthesis